ncbi:hypothetical protein [Streptococcus sp. 116-D4]|uniref:hypothetical protein n=1 Tax=Streptococcus sp. 116-D4 TaxID=2598453 RepID=UPI0012B4DBAC|nr:hypothetical protein [Streptococcus sp. 116-D4]BBP08896.1 hypothetical protein UKS_00980 [Streptococcus sp. 116-D4]
MIKGKIIKITEATVYIGYEDGSLKEIPIESCDFEPSIGDYVEVYGDIVIKIDSKNKISKVKKSISERLSLVAHINLVLVIIIAIITVICSIYLGYQETIALVVLESTIMCLLNLAFLIISSIKKSKVNKDISFKCFIIALVCVILSFMAFGFVEKFTEKTPTTVSRNTTSQNSSNSSSSLKASSSTTPSLSRESSSSSSSSVPSKPKITVDNDKANYGEVDYNKWNHDEIAVDTKVRVYGKVLQAMEDGKAYTLRVAINDDYDKIILVSIPSEYNNRVIAEDDHITLYGLVKGRQSYETVFKSTKTLPLMVAYMYEN